MRGSTIIICPYCGKSARLQNYRLKEGRRNFCCKSCADAYQREHPELSPRYNGGKIKLQCSNCGKDVYRKKNQIARNKTGRFFCSIKCRQEFSKGEFAPYYRNAVIKMVCDNCGIEFTKKRTNIKEKNFCCTKCASDYHSGENNQNWNGGSSFEPYCEKFNKEFKERVRAFFDYKCAECGKSEFDNGKNLSVHHVHYDKTSCCSNAPRQFVALCTRCHALTNHKREYWRRHFEEMLEEKYGGKSYFTREEMELLIVDE